MGNGSLSPGKLERAQRAIRFLSSLPIVDNSQAAEFYLNQQLHVCYFVISEYAFSPVANWRAPVNLERGDSVELTAEEMHCEFVY